MYTDWRMERKMRLRESLCSEKMAPTWKLQQPLFFYCRGYQPTSFSKAELSVCGSALLLFMPTVFLVSSSFPLYSPFPGPVYTPIPPMLENPKLKSIPTLANDLQLIFQRGCGTEDRRPSRELSKETCTRDGDNHYHLKRSLLVLDQDLNCLPNSGANSELLKSRQTEQNATGVAVKKKKRADSKDVARIALEDLAKYFDLPIVEASRNLNVGLTVLKRKCREFGIPRWPHRKIKSLDGLIRDLQEEAEQRQQDEAAAYAVAKRRMMLETEKESIEKEPFIELKSETKRFRQDIFKRRHKARALKN
ncbi:hypothetical protein GOBAR_AA38519 [Gossypium barbadense]|uniref:RWP-RK domain-containing protein n=1 Tax=Gossypium barbadense TaxID=3634 RepID=A0A2P5VTM9_GOSBA|nr:hypothetical protein GOBAR_AA38519 [Gossypium barbadense]